MSPTTVIAACSVPTCERVGRVKRGMCYPCYQLWLKKNPKPTSRTSTGKICRGCKEDKPLTEFQRARQGKDGLHARCRTCVSAQQREWKINNPTKGAEYHKRWLARHPDYKPLDKHNNPGYRRRIYLATGWNKFLTMRYGITADDFYSMLAAQGGGCAICGRKDSGEGSRQMHVDHCHRTGKNRGILCGSCNKGMGMFADDPNRMMSAVSYLLQYEDVLSQGGGSL